MEQARLAADAADASGPDFGCLNVPLPTSVPDPVTITGQVSDEASPIAADLEVHRASDDSLIDSVTTGTDGNYSLTVPTGGTVFLSAAGLNSSPPVTAFPTVFVRPQASKMGNASNSTNLGLARFMVAPLSCTDR